MPSSCRSVAALSAFRFVGCARLTIRFSKRSSPLIHILQQVYHVPSLPVDRVVIPASLSLFRFVDGMGVRGTCSLSPRSIVVPIPSVVFRIPIAVYPRPFVKPFDPSEKRRGRKGGCGPCAHPPSSEKVWRRVSSSSIDPSMQVRAFPLGLTSL